MSTHASGLPLRYRRTPDAARVVGLSIRTLEKHRIYGTGPRYSKLGGRVVYRVEGLQAGGGAGGPGAAGGPATGPRRAPAGRGARRQPCPHALVQLVADPCQRVAACALSAISSSSSGLCQV